MSPDYWQRWKYEWIVFAGNCCVARMHPQWSRVGVGMNRSAKWWGLKRLSRPADWKLHYINLHLPFICRLWLGRTTRCWSCGTLRREWSVWCSHMRTVQRRSRPWPSTRADGVSSQAPEMDPLRYLFQFLFVLRLIEYCFIHHSSGREANKLLPAALSNTAKSPLPLCRGNAVCGLVCRAALTQCWWQHSHLVQVVFNPAITSSYTVQAHLRMPC